LVSAGGSGDNSSVSLQCFADDTELHSLTMLLSVTLVNVTSPSAADFLDDIFVRLYVPGARENSDNIRVTFGVLDFVRSALFDFVCCLMIVCIILCSFIVCSNSA